MSFFSLCPIAFLALFSAAFLCFYTDVEGRIPVHFERNKKFAKCCKDLGVFSVKAVRSICKYSPSGGSIPPLDVRKQIAANMDAYIGCYAAHKNNTQCCYDNGVKGALYDPCREFCCGGPKPCPGHTKPLPMYAACVKVKAIVACNAAAWDDDAMAE